MNRVKCAVRGKRSERDGEAYGKSDMSMIYYMRYVVASMKNSKNAEIYANVLKELGQR